MNVNWKEAILQAQKKIDQVLDIRPETIEIEENETTEDVIDQNCSSPSQGSEPLGDDIVMLEPVLPPFLNNRYIGDDIQTIISSDIEHLTRVSSRSNSPERGKTDFEKELSVSMASPAQVSMLTPVPMPDATLPNPEDILNQAINGLRKELMEYKKANQILQSSQANLEREMEESRFGANEKVVSMLNEEREHFNQEISQLRVTCSQAISEKLELEEKYRNSEQIWNHTEKILKGFRHQIVQIKSGLKETEETFASDFKVFGTEIKRILSNEVRKKSSRPEVVRLPCNCEKNFGESQKVVIKHEAKTQTDPEKKQSWQNEEVTQLTAKSNVADLLQIIEKLEIEKKQLLVQRKSDKEKIERLQDQLNETLIMHGEKIEQLDEILVDNEELKNILKQQALALTKTQ